jgi:NADP-dependent 3-hydroxy acid dehydrogenase YdfG
MVRSLKGKVIAIPFATTAAGAAIAKLVAAEEGALLLGAATSSQLRNVEAGVPKSSLAYAVQVDLERPKSVDEFFKIAIGQFGGIDAIVLEMTKITSRMKLTEKSIGFGVRRLLHCLDAALQYSEEDLHVVNIAPVAGRYAIPVATAFLGAKLATSKAGFASAPSLRMSVVSPFDDDASDAGTLARTVLHVLRERRSPDIAELILRRRLGQENQRAKPAATRSKIVVPM